MYFPVADIHLFPLFPVIIAFVLSLICSTAGVTGAFLLLPFQVSVLGFQGPAVTTTNHFFNVVGSPGGVIRLIREKRFISQLAVVLIAGTGLGALGGIFIRLHFLVDPALFKLFVGLVLMLLGLLILARWRRKEKDGQTSSPDKHSTTRVISFNLRQIEYEFQDKRYRVNVPLVFSFSVVIGLISSAYGIGGGVLTAAFLTGICKLPIHTTAGAVLLQTFFTSTLSVIGYTLLSPLYATAGISTSPDWMLGLLFGIGGLGGTYVGARLQKFIPGRWIGLMLALIMVGLAAKYFFGFYR